MSMILNNIKIINFILVNWFLDKMILVIDPLTILNILVHFLPFLMLNIPFNAIFKH